MFESGILKFWCEFFFFIIIIPFNWIQPAEIQICKSAPEKKKDISEILPSSSYF